MVSILGNFGCSFGGMHRGTTGELLGCPWGDKEVTELLLRANCGTGLLLLVDSEDYLVTKDTTGQLGQCVKCDYLEYCKEYYSKTAGGWGL